MTDDRQHEYAWEAWAGRERVGDGTVWARDMADARRQVQEQLGWRVMIFVRRVGATPGG